MLKTPLEKIFNSRHPIPARFSSDGNLMMRLPKWKLLRLGKSRSDKYFNWLKQISSPASPSPSFVTISLILLHSYKVNSLSWTKLLTVVKVAKLIKPWHFDILKVFKFLKYIEDGTEFFLICCIVINVESPNFEMPDLVESFPSINALTWAF